MNEKMMNEREYVIKAFHTHFQKDKNIVIYGLGKNTKLLLQEFPEYHFMGLLDDIHTGEFVYGKKVLSLQETIEGKADLILILARQGNINIIYHRIESFCLEHKLPVFDINGNTISKQQSDLEHRNFQSWITREQMRQEIFAHDVISFDVFDTLVMRKTLYPQDIFHIVETQADYRHQKNYDFAKQRAISERELSITTVPDIDAIYEKLQKNLNISKTETKMLLDLELEVERNNLIVRKDMQELCQWAIDIGKKVYLVTDMYLPEKILTELLGSLGIVDYEKLLISCEFGKTKETGLFQELKRLVGEKRILHIGDNPETDQAAAENEGLDAFRIQSGIDMLELSDCRDMISKCKTPEDRLMLGLFVSSAFQNPFLFSKTKGKLNILSCEAFGFMLVGSVITTFLYWMTAALKNSGKDLLLLSSRDGYLMERLFKKIKADIHNTDLPEYVYFLTSRMACVAAGISDLKDIEYATTLAFSGTPSEMLEQRFFVQADGQLPYDGKEELNSYIQKHQEAILNEAEKRRKSYKSYIKQFDLESFSHISFFDFVSSGTCQRFLEKLVCKNLQGYYFIRLADEDEEKRKLKIESLYEESYVYEKRGYLGQSYVCLEQIITSFEPSLQCFDKEGNPVYLSENRTVEQLQELKQVQEGIEAYFDSFYKNYPNVQSVKLNLDLADGILGLMQSQYSIMGDQVFTDTHMTDEFCNRKFSFFESII